MIIGNRNFDLDKNCYIMAILNVTPDSFSDGGKWNDIDRAKAHVKQMIEEGADLIDVGGESTRPGHVQISIQEEIDRVVPYIKMIKKNFDIPVSIDSYKPEVVEAALAAGADFVNDIWGLKSDPKMAELIVKYDVPCCLMHNRNEIVKGNAPEDFMDAFMKDMRETLSIAERAGINKDKIILDPGVGFGKDYKQNLIIINRLEEMHKLGYPILLATSRKSVIGNTLDLPTDERVEGTLTTTVLGIIKGACFVRVHDIKENARTIKMTKAVLGEGL